MSEKAGSKPPTEEKQPTPSEKVGFQTPTGKAGIKILPGEEQPTPSEKVGLKIPTAEERRKEVQEEKAKGKEMEGATEVEAQLRQVTDLVRSNQVAKYKRGENGWQLKRYSLKHEFSSRDFFDFDANDGQLKVRVYSDEDEGFFFEVKDFRRSQLSIVKGVGIKNVGNSMSFAVKEGRVQHWHKGKIMQSYGEEKSRRLPLEESFGQAEFDNARKLIADLTSDITALPPRTKKE